MQLRQIKKKALKAPIQKQTGFILWEGYSPVDNAHIVAIATLTSKNEKTGNMVQTWILRTDIEPNKAVKNSQDSAICGACPFASGKGCYVRAEQAPLAVFKAYHKGNYKRLSFDELPLVGVNRSVRLGAYGDPAMVPTSIWKQVIKNSLSWTGYTHQIKAPWFDKELAKICMVSADTLAESEKYNALGLRTFTAISDQEDVPGGQLVCPNFTHGTRCVDCGLCNGSIGNGKSIIAPIHGTKQKIVKFIKNRK